MIVSTSIPIVKLTKPWCKINPLLNWLFIYFSKIVTPPILPPPFAIPPHHTSYLQLTLKLLHHNMLLCGKVWSTDGVTDQHCHSVGLLQAFSGSCFWSFCAHMAFSLSFRLPLISCYGFREMQLGKMSHLFFGWRTTYGMLFSMVEHLLAANFCNHEVRLALFLSYLYIKHMHLQQTSL